MKYRRRAARAAALPQRLNQARFDASVYVDCSVDINGAISAALTKALSAEGRPSRKSRTVFYETRTDKPIRTGVLWNALKAVCRRAGIDAAASRFQGFLSDSPLIRCLKLPKTESGKLYKNIRPHLARGCLTPCYDKFNRSNERIIRSCIFSYRVDLVPEYW
ncbi:MAG: hypothetical protein LBE74_02020 [Treponema sp.]|jgi:hypothetical protein|nr:hypothetical protein [Treponema sp.]